jgi:hypothetical protein
MLPEASLLFAIFKQIILDYIKLDPDSDCVSADYFKSEGEDFKVTEDIIYNGQPVYFNDLIFTFDDLCLLFKDTLSMSPYKLKKQIAKKSIEY